MMRSLAFKLTLVIVFVGLLGVAVVAFFSQQATRREFSNFIIVQARTNFIEEVAGYYQANGTWDGVLAALPRPQPLPRQGQPPPPRPNSGPKDPPGPGRPKPADLSPPRNANFLLLDAVGCVVTPIPPYAPNECLDSAELAAGDAVMVGDEQVGTILTLDAFRPELGGVERAYLTAMNNAIRNATLAATALALILGLLLARYLTRPLKELTTAIRAMTIGELKQEVTVRSQDELGELATTFNQMSADVAHANHLRRQMTADIAHDLRNPLSVLSGYIESMRDGVLEPTEERLQIMHNEANHLQHLVDDLWTLARGDAGELSLLIESVPVAEMLERVAASFTEQAQSNNIELRVEMPSTNVMVDIDRERMAQVLGNLMHNAFRHTQAGGRVQLVAAATAEGVNIDVCDNGSGIVPDALPLIFERFYRADEARVHNNGESGLGLAIAKMIVNAHGGEITAQSVPNVETRFRIWLPQER